MLYRRTLARTRQACVRGYGVVRSGCVVRAGRGDRAPGRRAADARHTSTTHAARPPARRRSRVTALEPVPD